ncbi:MAG: hypothetical protein QOF96_2497 [Actinomycetota bacterium]|jgi:hypothetical protein|nr:hypothetical protein [Actinomycetota bacterium]
MAVVNYADNEVEVEGARWRDGDVWVPAEALRTATGWELRPEGVCAGESCVPLPPGATWSGDDGFNLSAFGRHLGLAEAADADRGLVAFVPGPGGAGPTSVEAPDFTLPDLDGNLHSLSDFRGRKVLLLAWGSY